jgi:hypothetical protein
MLTVAALVTQASAESTYRIDHLSGGDVWFSRGSLPDEISTYVRFIGSETVVSSGDETPSSAVGLCVYVYSHYEKLAGTYSSTWSEIGCTDITPAPGSPLSVSATVPTVLSIYEGILSAPRETRASSVTLDLTWLSTQNPPWNHICSPGGGSTRVSAVPVRASTGTFLFGTQAAIRGSVSSATQGDLFGNPQACFVEGYFAGATVAP